MSLVSFARRTRVLTVDGRRFVCRPPTVATVARVYELLLGEVWAIAKMVYRDGRELTPDDVLDGLTGDMRFASVLETCVTLHGAAPGELVELLAGNEAMQRRLALCCASLVEDWDAVLESLHLEEFGKALPGEGERPADSDGPSEHEAIVWSVATACGQSPVSVAEWAYEDLLAAHKTARWIASASLPSGERETAREGPKLRADSPPEVLAQHGVVVQMATRRPVA